MGNLQWTETDEQRFQQLKKLRAVSKGNRVEVPQKTNLSRMVISQEGIYDLDDRLQMPTKIKEEEENPMGIFIFCIVFFLIAAYYFFVK